VTMRQSRRLAAVLLVFGLAGCASDQAAPEPEASQALKVTPGMNLTALARLCPPAVIDDEDAYRQVFSPSSSTDQPNLVYQASLVKYARTCAPAASGDQLEAKIAVAGRVVGGPKAKAGPLTLPIRVEVVDGSQVYYDKVINQQVTLPPDSLTTQFLFKAVNLPVPLNVSDTARIRVGIED